MNKKICCKIGLALGIALIIAGIVFLFLSGSHIGANGIGLSRANTNIKFGADFYTTSAEYTGLAANAIVDLYAIVKAAIGIFFIFAGGTDCAVWLLLMGGKDTAEEIPQELQAEVKTEEPVDVPPANEG
ncbi:MAG: hypothetical protein IJ594_09520 [Oscillospiraceae bacterium]|nr:hypothetical protein [Oscillospiraceae bacterium]